MAVAVDAQGAEAPRRYAAAVKRDFPVLLDAEGALAQTFGFRAIPNGLMVSPDGKLDAIVAGGFDIRRPSTEELVRSWLEGNEIPLFEPPAGLWSEEALGLFREAAAAVRRDDRQEAVRLLKQAYPLEPDNYIIRKQMWAIENPERFYGGEIDKEWQRQRLEQGL